jgi:mono/diheme cytochrome c family protein
MHARKLLIVTGMSLLASCGDDDSLPSTDDAGREQLDAGEEPITEMDAEVERDADDGEDEEGGEVLLDAGLDGGLDAGNAMDPVVIERGRYLTSVVYPCGSCHTSRTEPTKIFAGVDCWTDTLPSDPTMGCLSSRNLTNHETGIKNFSLTELKDLILKGQRPDGKYLHPQMPYSLLGNMRDEDAFAIVAYLRSLPAIDHMVSANQAPFNVQPSAPAERWPDALIPSPRPDYPDQRAALNGRYLAGSLGGCMDCHTARNADNTPIKTKAFQGGRRFTTASVAEPYFSPNLTPHATGIADFSVDDIVRAIKRGEDKNQGYSKLCPPMPSGPMGAYGMMSDADARDIAHYLLSLPPVENVIAVDCQLPPADAGVADGGAGDAGSDAGADSGVH